jgi:hydroxymethylbilane synthase
MPTELPRGLALTCCLPREDPRDALIATGGVKSLQALPQGAVMGTASLRRTAQLLHIRPDLAIVPMRGNVGTRLQKLADGQVMATVLAVAGLRRLDQAGCISCVLEPDMMLPSAGQGIIAIETRTDDVRTRALVAAIDDFTARVAAEAERALLAALDGSCRTPIGALATVAHGRVRLDALVIRPDGKGLHRTRREGEAGEAHAMGLDAGAELRRRAGPDLAT